MKNFEREAQISVLYTVRNSLIFEILNKLMERIVPAGIPQYLNKYHESNVYRTFYPIIDIDPKVLTLQNLEYGFVLWIGSCGISAIGFLMEHLWLKGRRVCRSIIGLWMLMSILRIRLRNGLI
ncbi:hypothetical protein ACKWTF_014551 [Chironomus riparius]